VISDIPKFPAQSVNQTRDTTAAKIAHLQLHCAKKKHPLLSWGGHKPVRL